MGARTYAELQEQKQEILVFCKDTEKQFGRLAEVYHNYAYQREASLRELMGRIQQENFKVIVIGKFSTGKSSLINALLGDEVLPDSLNPCTAYINEVTYGEEKKAAISFKAVLPENWEQFVQHEGVKEHIRAHLGGPIPDYVVEDLEQLADCVTIPYDDDAEEEENISSIDCSPFEKAVIYYPCELCKNGIEIIDSPGLDESRDRTEIVEAYLKKVDAVIYVTTNIATGGDGDKEIIEHYLDENEIKNVFFICNLFGIRMEKAKKQLLPRLHRIFAERTVLGEKGVHMINVGDPLNSGIQEFKAGLADYLNNERGNAVLHDYIEKLIECIQDMKSSMPGFRTNHEVKLEDVEDRIKKLQGRLVEQKNILKTAEQELQALKKKLEDKYRIDLMDNSKRISFANKKAIKEADFGTRALTNDATKEEGHKYAVYLGNLYTTRYEAEMMDYLQHDLKQALTAELREDLRHLQTTIDWFAGKLDNCVLADNKRVNWKNISTVALTHAQTLGNALSLEINDLISYDALCVIKLVERSVDQVFMMYSDYVYEKRGSKLSLELQDKLSHEIWERSERYKRDITDGIQARVFAVMNAKVYNVITATMKQAIAAEEELLAAYQAEREDVLKSLAAEKQVCAEVNEALLLQLAQLPLLEKQLTK